MTGNESATATGMTGGVVSVTGGVPSRWPRHDRGGGIVVTVSAVGLPGDPFVPYSSAVAKTGIVNLVRQAAFDLASWQTRHRAGPVADPAENRRRLLRGRTGRRDSFPPG